jgi:hypothetical protein
LGAYSEWLFRTRICLSRSKAKVEVPPPWPGSPDPVPAQAVAYFRALEKASPKIRLLDVGKTAMGKPMIYAVITSQENMGRLDRYKEIARKLSLARHITDAEAHSLASEGKAIVYIDGGLHATEVAPAQQDLQLAYDLITSQDPSVQSIRESDILVLG